MAGSESDPPPPGMDSRSSGLGMQLNTARAFTDGSFTTFDEAFETVEPVFGTLGANTGRNNETVEPVGAGHDSDADNETAETVAEGQGSDEDTHDKTDTDQGIFYKKFKHFPLEIRSKIWVAAAEAVRPCGVYHFTFQSILHSSKCRDPGRIDTVIANSDRINTFTPSAAVAEMTRATRDLLRSCSEARNEIMRCPRLSSSFDFHYLKDDKFDTGTIRPFHYDTDWVSMDGLDDDDPGIPGTDKLRCTPDINRIQHLALPYASFNPDGLFARRPPNAGGRRSLRIFRWLDSLRSVGLYAPSFTIKRPRNWARVIASTRGNRLFLKALPAPAPGPASAPSWSATEYHEAMEKLRDLAWLMYMMEQQRTAEGWPATACDFAALQFCFIMHSEGRKGLDLMKFKEDGSHLEGVDLDDLGKMGIILKQLPLAADIIRRYVN